MFIGNPSQMPVVQGSLIIPKMDTLKDEAKKRGATEGIKRLEFICSQYKQLTPYTAHLWLNPGAVQEEIEEAQTNLWWIHFIQFFRNVFSLAPLIVTWFALFDAVTGYQQDLVKNPADNTVPFLQLWQSGFNGFSKLTFSEAAGIDIVLLILYLICLVTVNFIENRAHARAVQFLDSKTWCEPITALMIEIDRASKPFVANKSDIDNMVDAIDRVIVTAVESLKQTVTTAMQAVQQTVEVATESVKQTTADMTNANNQMMTTAQQSIKSFVDDARQTLNQVVTASEQTVAAVVTSSTQVLTQITTSSEQAIATVVTASEQAVTRVVTSSEHAVTQTLSLSQQAITESNKRVETLFEIQVKPLIEAFQHDLSALQGELRNYQSRLDDLTKSSETLAKAGLELSQVSKGLEDNAERYLTFGQDIRTQIAALSNIQQDVLSQIGSVAANISTAAGSMTDARSNMITAIHEVKTLAWQLDQWMQASTNTISTNIERASQSLEKITPPLEAASLRLYTASNLLASIRLFPFVRRRPVQ